jgi:hypothetical protein
MRTANSGRVRVTQAQADFLLITLNATRHRLVIRRAEAKSRGEETYSYNREIERLDSIKDELDRTMEEMGWPHG